MQNQSYSIKNENNAQKDLSMFMTAPNDNTLNESEGLDQLINSFDDRELQVNIKQNFEDQIFNKRKNPQFKSKTIYNEGKHKMKLVDKRRLSS